MKNIKSIITILICSLSFGLLGTSCSDMLEPNMERYTDNFAKDSVYSAFGVLKDIQNIAERSVILDATRSDLVATGTYTTDSIADMVNFANPEDGSNTLLNVVDYYHIINTCNFYLSKVDTTLVKNGYREMSKEYAAILSIRSWVYLQLINVYGEVPYVTTPIASVEEAERIMASKDTKKINNTNIADLFMESGMDRAWEIQELYGLPNYDAIKISSSVTFKTQNMFIPADLVMGDAFLIQNEYEKAATRYFHFFNTSSLFTSPATATMNSSFKFSVKEITNADPTYYDLNSKAWLNAFTTQTSSGNTSATYTCERLVISVGATSEQYGTVFKSLQGIFGFKTSFSRGSNASVQANEEYQQLLPSQSYISLNKDQQYHYYSENSKTGEIISEYVTIDGENPGDARYYATAPGVTFASGERSRIIDKYATTSASSAISFVENDANYNQFSMVYQIPLYRNPVVWLRYAEAINRLGFPQTAFGVLKDGLSRQSLPTYDTLDMNCYKIDSIFYDEDHPNLYYLDTTGVYVLGPAGDTIDLKEVDIYNPLSSLIDTALLHVITYVAPKSLNGGCYYVTADETKRSEAYPDAMGFRISSRFDMDLTSKTGYYGIHGRGCGDIGGYQDTVYTYARMVAKKAAEIYARKHGLVHEEQLEYEETLHRGDTLLLDDKDAIIEAVEELIVDEGALESAFETNRFQDLMRVAGHKTAAGDDGNIWLARKVARRDFGVNENINAYNDALWNKLVDRKNWFFSLPKEIK